MGEVSKAFGVTLPAITQTADRLERKHLVRRGTDPGDRRVSTLDLTTEGTAVVNQLDRLRVEALQPSLRRMSTRDRSRIIEALEALVEAAALEPSPKGPGPIEAPAARGGTKGRT